MHGTEDWRYRFLTESHGNQERLALKNESFDREEKGREGVPGSAKDYSEKRHSTNLAEIECTRWEIVEYKI